MNKKDFHQSLYRQALSKVDMVDCFKLAHFMGPLELKNNDSQKYPIVQALSNPINVFFK